MTTKQTIELLRNYESRNVMFAEPDGSWPIVWERAKGVHVWDAEGKKYLDLTAAFGVAAAGHANPNVVKAGQKQMGKLLHAMGDVHPHALKAQLAQKISEITFERWADFSELKTKNSKLKTGKVIFSNSGFEAVESALKTAILATQKRGVIAFEGAYHGLGYGALNATHRNFFRSPFQSQLREFGQFAIFPATKADLVPLESFAAENFRARTHRRNSSRTGSSARRHEYSAKRIFTVAPKTLRRIRRTADSRRNLHRLRSHRKMVRVRIFADDSRSDLSRQSVDRRFSAVRVRRARKFDGRRVGAASTGEAIHTSTFLGHPVGCAMALAQIAEIEKLNLPERSAELGKFLLEKLNSTQNSKLKIKNSARGLGLMAAVELNLPDGKPATEIALNAIKTLLHHGYIFLPEGEHGNIISFTPPLTISKTQLAKAVAELKKVLTTDGYR